MAQYLVVEFLDIKRIAKFLPGSLAHLQDFQSADAVAAGIAGIDQVAGQLGITLWLTGHILEIGSRLVQGPALGVDAGIDHRPHSAQQAQSQTPQIGHGLAFVEAHFPGQDLGI